MQTNNHITLRDGRRLAYAEFGVPSGEPVLYFHGAPSSRLEPLLLGDDVLARHGLRVIAADRPGMGGSDFQRGRGFSSWSADVVELADALGLARFSILGNSGGGAYVAACAARIPERVHRAVIVSGGWRMDTPEVTANLPFVHRLVFILARRAPPLLRLLLRSMGGVAQGDPKKELEQIRKRVPPQDYEAFAAPGRVAAFGEGMRECFRQGPRGAAWDMQIYVRDFDFTPEEVRIPIAWFHGEKDKNMPIEAVRAAAARMPTVRLVTYPDEAHLSTLCNHVDDFAAALKNPT